MLGIGIEHDGKTGAWKFLGWELVDLANFRVKLKAEFQASNLAHYLWLRLSRAGKKRRPTRGYP